jgi:two-component system sensor histidine kinase HydH
MTALLYLVVGVLVIALGVRGMLPDRRDAGRLAFFGLGTTVGVAYVAFALSLLPGLSVLRLLYMAAGLWAPPFALWTVDRVFRTGSNREVGLLFLATGVLSPVLVFTQAALFRDIPRASPAEVAAGVLCFLGFGSVLLRLWRLHDQAELAAEKLRLRYLLGAAVGAVAFTLLEQTARALVAPIELGGLPVASRGVELQGVIPPISVFLSGIALYFLYHGLVLYRLLDLNEIFARLGALVISAALLVMVDGLTVMWVDVFTSYPFHGTFQIFLGSLLFLAGYDVVRDTIARATNRLFNRRGQQLEEALDALRAELPTVTSTRGLADALLGRLHTSGRVLYATVYLWDRKLDAFVCVASRGDAPTPALATVAPGPLSEHLEAGGALSRAALDARDADPGLLDLLDAMHADVLLPLRSPRGAALGWVGLRPEAWSDGFSRDEIDRLARLSTTAGTVLANIRDFQALEEQHRLAALGGMAAGLAHEIRNPLAGIKGAAQYLQAERLSGDAAEMLAVVVEETDRLDVVVRQFLDYARPDVLTLELDHVNALAAQQLALMRAEGLPPGVRLVDDLAPDLPAFRFDRPRLGQVLLNLLRNGIQSMPDGGVLTVRTRRTRRGVEIVVSDTGVGIPPEMFDRLFEPFFTTKRDGTGLGLAIAHRLVRAHGGDLDVVSAPGTGTTFTVRLPVEEA